LEQIPSGRIDVERNNKGKRIMKNILTAALVLGFIAAPISFAVAQSGAPSTQTAPSDRHDSINGSMPRTHDAGAAVGEDNNNGLVGGRSSSSDTSTSDRHDSIDGSMPRTHDAGAAVGEDNNNGLK
jgi:hypothetical protein